MFPLLSTRFYGRAVVCVKVCSPCTCKFCSYRYCLLTILFRMYRNKCIYLFYMKLLRTFQKSCLSLQMSSSVLIHSADYVIRSVTLSRSRKNELCHRVVSSVSILRQIFVFSNENLEHFICTDSVLFSFLYFKQNIVDIHHVADTCFCEIRELKSIDCQCRMKGDAFRDQMGYIRSQRVVFIRNVAHRSTILRFKTRALLPEFVLKSLGISSYKTFMILMESATSLNDCYEHLIYFYDEPVKMYLILVTFAQLNASIFRTRIFELYRYFTQLIIPWSIGWYVYFQLGCRCKYFTPSSSVQYFFVQTQ